MLIQLKDNFFPERSEISMFWKTTIDEKSEIVFKKTVDHKNICRFSKQ